MFSDVFFYRRRHDETHMMLTSIQERKKKQTFGTQSSSLNGVTTSPGIICESSLGSFFRMSRQFELILQ